MRLHVSGVNAALVHFSNSSRWFIFILNVSALFSVDVDASGT